MRLNTKLLLALALLAGQAAMAGRAAADDAACRVRDPELQGSYRGGCKAGWADGEGEALGTASYKGGFVDGYKQGRGVKTWPSGDRYEGEFVHDHKQGQGRYTWGRLSPFRGETYEGGFVQDRREGRGVYRWPDGEVYDGPWVADRLTGVAPDGLKNRVRHLQALRRAVAKPGAIVCQDVAQAGARKSRIRGHVAAVSGDLLTVALDPSQEGGVTASGQSVKAGGAIHDEPFIDWVPCY